MMMMMMMMALDEIATATCETFRNCDVGKFEIQTEDITTPPNRASVIENKIDFCIFAITYIT